MAYVGNQVRCCPMRISMPLSILLVVSYSQDHLRECLGPCRFFWCLECCSFPIGSIHSRVPCWGFSITRMGLFPPPFLASVWFLFLTLPWKIKICTASKCSASEESLKEIGRNCLNLSRFRCCMETPIVSQTSLLCFVARNFWVHRASAWTNFSCVFRSFSPQATAEKPFAARQEWVLQVALAAKGPYGDDVMITNLLRSF